MLIEVLCVCRRPPDWVSTATHEYARRLPRDFALEFSFLAPARAGNSAAQRQRDEAQRILKRCAGNPLIALDERGQAHNSTELAGALAALRERHQKIALVVGAADGLDASVLAHAHGCWTLSRLTLPHLLVQVVLAEQVYRAWSILEQHPYHRA